MVKNYMSFRIQ